MEQKYLIAGIIAIIAISALMLNNANQPQSSGERALSNSDNKEAGAAYPQDYMLYQEYLQAIGEGLSASPRYFDNGVIEATVISLRSADICPSATGETCNIEPYPNDYAIVRVDRIVSYSSYAEQTVSQPVEQPSGAQTGGGGSSTPGNRGVDYPQQKVPEIARLQEGQNASAHLILTAKPTKVRYVSVAPESGGLESQQSASRGLDLTETVTHTSEPGKKTFEPIPKENGYFVFTTKIVPYPEVSQKILPGLKVGDKFRASIRYDGAIVVVGEYEIIP